MSNAMRDVFPFLYDRSVPLGPVTSQLREFLMTDDPTQTPSPKPDEPQPEPPAEPTEPPLEDEPDPEEKP